MLGQQMAGSEAGPLAIWREQIPNLVLLSERTGIAATQISPDQLEQPEVASWHLVVAALAAQREYLHRPRPDTGDRTQPAPRTLVIAAVQVNVAARHLACSAHERERTRGAEVEGLQQRGRRARQHGRCRQVAQITANPIAVQPAASQRRNADAAGSLPRAHTRSAAR